VGVLNGVAHLAGAVDALAIRTAAEELVQRMEGVRGVVNRIEAPGAPSPAREINLDLKNRKQSSDVRGTDQ
jgi:osmotically-inducible protein OsmY